MPLARRSNMAQPSTLVNPRVGGRHAGQLSVSIRASVHARGTLEKRSGNGQPDMCVVRWWDGTSPVNAAAREAIVERQVHFQSSD